MGQLQHGPDHPRLIHPARRNPGITEKNMNRRTAYLMREFIELQTAMVAIGSCSTRYAAHQMAINGVPLDVALRTLVINPAKAEKLEVSKWN